MSMASGEIGLPGGPCNFVDLRVGPKAPTCGCQRFWLNAKHGNPQDRGAAEETFCFCGHHACYHDAFSQQLRAQEPAAAASRVSRGQAAGRRDVNGGSAVEAPSNPPKPLTGLGILPAPAPAPQRPSQSAKPDIWQAINGFARAQEEGWMSDSSTSALPSTNAPSLIEEPTPSSDRNAPARLQQLRPVVPQLTIPSELPPAPPAEYSPTEVATELATEVNTPAPPAEWSPTEVNTPSRPGTPDFQAVASSSTQPEKSPGHLEPGRFGPRQPRIATTTPLERPMRPSTAPVPHAPATTRSTMSARDIESLLRAYGQRIEALESISFSHVSVDDIHDILDLIDARLLDLEHWRADQEQNDSSPEPTRAFLIKLRRLLATMVSPLASDASFDSSATAHTEAAVLATLTANAEAHPRLNELEDRVADLERTALPSFARPWHVQVVLLPWGRDLKGIWFSSKESTEHSLKASTQASEEWARSPSAPKLSFKSSDDGAWTTESIQAWSNETNEWLSPKACGSSGKAFQRLVSRGLVRDVTLTAPDARHILDAVGDVFRGALQTEVELNTDETRQYQGLREPFIPLRKIRKSARLRFLNPSEMVTSASWTATFLESSVFMNVTRAHKRLFMTTPAAYIQPSETGWSWKNIRQLPECDAIDGERAAQEKHVPAEACWNHNRSLDVAAGGHASSGSHGSQWSTRTQLAANDAGEAERQVISHRSGPHVPHQSTVSLPISSATVERGKDSQTARRVTLFDPSETTAVPANESVAEAANKRRRISITSGTEKRQTDFTSSRSCEPVSPLTSEAVAERKSLGASSRKRLRTPSAYATPHSHNNFRNRMRVKARDLDIEGNPDRDAEHGERGEEEWQGVDDGSTNCRNCEAVLHEAQVVQLGR